MKARSILLSLATLLLALTTCKKDPQPIMERFELSREDITVGTTTANIVGTYTYTGTVKGINVLVSEDGVHQMDFVADINGKNFTVSISGLNPATRYQYQYVVDYGFSQPFKTSAKYFTTLNETPTVRTLDVINIDSTTVRVNCEVVSDGGIEIIERGVCWNTYGNPNYDDEKLVYSEAGTGAYSCRIGGLSPYTNYHVKAYAINSSGTSYGEEIAFSTLSTGYTINLAANPENGGTVTGGGVYYGGQNCIVVAQANSGFVFSHWSENNTLVSSEAIYAFVVTRSRNLMAHFTQQLPDSYAINVSANNLEWGSVVGGGLFQYGQSCTVMATAKEGYSFVNWTEEGVEVSTEATYTFSVTNNRTLVANFIAQHIVSVSANPNDGGTVIGGGTYYYGQSCTVIATANNGYIFTNWTENGNVVSINSNYSFTITGNQSLVANFTLIVPSGATNGLFSVSDSKRVFFSQGNLQYIGSASIPYWKFADNQWDYLGNNGQGSTSQNVDRDLFGWGTSGWNCGNNYYQPWDTYYSNEGNQYGPPNGNNLNGNYANSDWGVFNAISNGGNTVNMWRTLTKEEWDYVLNTRTTDSGIRYAKAQVNGISGMILLPDNWNNNYYELNDTNSSVSGYDSNIINAEEWLSTFEIYGAVFLPASGYRQGTSIGGVSWGCYWSASSCGGNKAYDVTFYEGYIDTNRSDSRSFGHAVRLVQDFNW